MAINVQKREGESSTSLIYRFTKKIQRSGVLREAKKRRFTKRNVNKNARRRSALHKMYKKEEIEQAKKKGLL